MSWELHVTSIPEHQVDTSVLCRSWGSECVFHLLPSPLCGLCAWSLPQDCLPSPLILAWCLLIPWKAPCTHTSLPINQLSAQEIPRQLILISACYAPSTACVFFICLSLRREQLFSRCVIHSTAGLCFSSLELFIVVTRLLMITRFRGGFFLCYCSWGRE